MILRHTDKSKTERKYNVRTADGAGRIRILTIAGFVILATVLTGCSKQRAEMSSRKARTQIEQARIWQANEFDESRSSFESAEAALKDAQTGLDTQQFSNALSRAQDAVRLSKEAMEQSKTRFAARQLDNARRAVDVAQVNNGRNENAELFDRAQQKVQEAQERYDKQKFEDSIRLSTDSISAVDQLLAQLKNTAGNRLEELKGRLAVLEREQAEQYSPQSIIRAKESISQIERKVEVDRDYRQAIIMAGTAITEAENGITDTKRKRSNLELNTLEAKIAEAIAEEAPIYAPDALKTVQESYEDILKAFFSSQYDSVIQAAALLRPKVEELITITRIESTKDKIRSVDNGIRNLKEQAVEQYLPGRIRTMETLLSDAQQFFANNDYDSSKAKANEALVEQDRIVAAFDAIAAKAIQDADLAFTGARRTLERMVQIFNSQAAQQVVDQRLSASRQAETANLEARATQTAQVLADSNSNRARQQFKRSVEQARDVQSESESILNRTYKVVAEHVLVAIQDDIALLEREGARDRAAQQFTQVMQLVADSQRLLNQNQSRDAADTAARARAYLDNVRQELARRAITEQRATDQLLQRLEGLVAPPAPGALRVEGTEFPGGSSASNKEAMLLDEAAALLTAEPIVVAQLNTGTQPTHYSGTGYAPDTNNRNLPSGTFMTDQHHAPGTFANDPAGRPTGAIIGTRPEPVVRTSRGPGMSGSERGYEGVTDPGPFVAIPQSTGGAAGTAGFGGELSGSGDTISNVRAQIDLILSDSQRVADFRRFQPGALERARQRLEDSNRLLTEQRFGDAYEAARDAQRIIVEGEYLAAKRASEINLDEAARRINLSQAAGSIMFAPAQLTEAVNLYTQAELFLKRGEYLQARELSARAVVAADDARLYNVNKARDMAALSTRYQGWQAAHPALVEAEHAASVAEHLLADAYTACQGQEVAKQAVLAAQIALDSARDYTFQERIDNIYMALNQANRAGANYFNVTEVRQLIEELTRARYEYETRNFDSVELQLKDIEARLARVIETTPLVLEQNLQDTDARLKALVQAGAELYVAQEVDDVKSLMNRAAIDFRRRDFYSSYMNMRNAQKVTLQIEERLQEQVYFDAVTELFAQMDKTFTNFQNVLNYNPQFIKKLISTPHGQPAAVRLGGKASPNDFKDSINDIYLRAIKLKPPKAHAGTHEQVLIAIKHARVAADNFQKLYIMDQLQRPDAYEIIDTAYNQIRVARQMRSEIQVKMIDPLARSKVIRADKIVNF